MGKNIELEKEIKLKRELGTLLLNNFIDKDFHDINGFKNCIVIKFINIVEISIFVRFLINMNIKFKCLDRSSFIMRMADIYISRHGLVMETNFGYWSLIAVNQIREQHSVPFSIFCNVVLKNELLSPKLKPLLEEAFNFKETFGNLNDSRKLVYSYKIN